MYKRTNIAIDEEKLMRAKKEFEIYTTKEIVDFALEQLIRSVERKNILSMQGELKLDLNLKKSRDTK